MPRWSESQIASLLDTRLNQNIENPVSFDDLNLPKQWDQDDVSEEERSRHGFIVFYGTTLMETLPSPYVFYVYHFVKIKNRKSGG